jgi:hypothetical protein
MNRNLLRPPRKACLLLGAMTAATALLAADEMRTERVQFSKGSSSAVVNGQIKGYQSVDYVLGARAGQSMSVRMTTDNSANYFNILAPGETEVAFFNGSTSSNQYSGKLPANGDYRIRVYLMRSAAPSIFTSR